MLLKWRLKGMEGEGGMIKKRILTDSQGTHHPYSRNDAAGKPEITGCLAAGISERAGDGQGQGAGDSEDIDKSHGL